MASSLPDLPSGVEIARFVRITKNIGFVGGQEKTIEYDNTITTGEGEKRFRQYVEQDGSRPPEGAENGNYDLSDVARKRAILKVFNEADLSFEEFVKSETLFLVTWDHAQSIHIMEEDEMMQTLSAITSQEDRLRVEDIPSDQADLFSGNTSYNAAPDDVSSTPDEVEADTETEADDSPEPVEPPENDEMNEPSTEIESSSDEKELAEAPPSVGN